MGKGARPSQDQPILAQDEDQQSLGMASQSSISTVLKCWVGYIPVKGKDIKRYII